MAAMLMNEQIRVSEVQLTGLNGEDLGYMRRDAALALAREQGADLLCISLMSSPPPCKLVRKGTAKQEQQQERRQQGGGSQQGKGGGSKGQSGSATQLKMKELRLTPHIEEHDYDTKLRQAGKLLQSGNGVLLVVKATGKEGAKAKTLLERMTADLAVYGKKRTGIQTSGKGAMVELLPL